MGDPSLTLQTRASTQDRGDHSGISRAAGEGVDPETKTRRNHEASLLGGVTRSRRASPRPAQGLFPFISHASPSQAANNQLTQLAMEHSPKTLPISTTSQEERMPTRWSQHLLSPFPAYLLTTTHFRRRAHPAPPPASLPSRPGPGREGIVLGRASCWVPHPPPWISILCRSAIALLIQVAKSVLFFHFRIFFSPHLCSQFTPEAHLFLLIWVLPILSLFAVVTC